MLHCSDLGLALKMALLAVPPQLITYLKPPTVGWAGSTMGLDLPASDGDVLPTEPPVFPSELRVVSTCTYDEERVRVEASRLPSPRVCMDSEWSWGPS